MGGARRAAPGRSATAARMLSASARSKRLRLPLFEEQLAVAAEDDAPVCVHWGASSTRARGAWRGETSPGPAATSRGRVAERGHRAVDVGGGRLAREREAQHAGAVVDADRLQASAGAARPRRAGRAGRGEHAARLQRVQQRLGRQPRERQRGDVRRARRAGDRRARRPGPPASAAASSRSRSAATRRVGAGVERPPGERRPRARTRPAPAGSRCRRARPRSWPPPTHSGSSRAPGRTQSAPAPCGPWSLCAESASESAPSARGAQAQEAEGLHGVDVQVRARAGPRAATRRAARAISAIGCTVPSSLWTSMTATTAVSGRTAATTASARTTPSASGATTSAR